MQESAALALDAAEPARTVPSLRLVAHPEEQDGAGALPPVTSDLFVLAAALAAQRSPEQGAGLLRRGLDQAAAAQGARPAAFW